MTYGAGTAHGGSGPFPTQRLPVSAPGHCAHVQVSRSKIASLPMTKRYPDWSGLTHSSFLADSVSYPSRVAVLSPPVADVWPPDGGLGTHTASPSGSC